jgi:hypothetical protein
MPTAAEQIATIHAQTLQIMVDITASPKPSYSVGGRSFSHAEYLAHLRETVKWCEERLDGSANAPFEHSSVGIT